MANLFDTDIKLTPAEYKILKSIANKKPFRYDDAALLRLYEFGLITFTIDYDDYPNTNIHYQTCTVTTDGVDYIRHYTDIRFNVKAPIVVSVIALIISIIALLKP